MSMSAILVSLTYKIKHDVEAEAYKRYIARCLQVMTENTAITAGYYSNGEKGSYLPVSFDDLINPKPQKTYKQGEVVNRIREKMR